VCTTMGKLQVGDEAPDFELKDQDGNVVQLSEFKDRVGTSSVSVYE